MKRLHLQLIPDDFSPDRDRALSISSFLGRESLYPAWENLEFAEVYVNADEQAKGYRMIRGLAHHYYLPQFARKMNQRHGTNLSIDFWGVLLKPWLLLFLNMSWFLYTQLTTFVGQHPAEAFESEIMIKKDSWNFEDTADFIFRGYRNIQFHHWLLSLFIQEINPPNWVIVPNKSEKSDSGCTAIKKNPPLLIGLNHQISYLSSVQRCVDVYGLTRLQCLFVSLYLCLKPIRGKERADLPAELSPSGAEDYTGHFPATYLKVIGDNIEKALPKIFLEGFEGNYAKAKKARYVKNRIRLIGPVQWTNEPAKFSLAFAKENGEKIICTQHGGTYGIAKTPNLIPDVEYHHDGFFSWGWERHDPFPVRAYALPSPFLSKMKKKRTSCRKTDKLVFVGASLGPLELRFDILPKGKRLLQYRKEKITFMKRLSTDILKKTYYRPMPAVYPIYLEEKEYMRRNVSALKFIEGMPAPHPEMLKCRLLVLDNPQTTIHAGLAADIPTVCYWQRQDWAIADEARPYFAALEQAGVILPDAEAAAQRVNQIWDHVEDWWKGHEIQEARAAWCHEYARTDKFWWRSWIKTLWRI